MDKRPVDDPLDGAPADAAESVRIAREHDAVDFGPVEPLGLVHRALERADLAENFSRPAASWPSLPLPESASRSPLAAPRSTASCAGLPVRSRLCFSYDSLSHGVGSGVVSTRSRHLSRAGSSSAVDVRLPRLDVLGGARFVRDFGRVVLVGQPREVMAELVHEHVLAYACRPTRSPGG